MPADAERGEPPVERVAYLACLRGPGLGDLLQRNIFLGVLRRAFPAASVTFVTGEALTARFAGVLERHLLVDDVMTCPDAGEQAGAAWDRFTEALRRRRFDACVADVDSAVLGTEVARRAGIPLRIAVPTGGGDRSVTHPVLLRAPLFGRPDLYEYACALARAAGGTVTPRASELLPALPRVPERVPELAQPRPIVALHPGGAPHWNRRWPLDRYAGLAVRLARERAASLLVVGGRDERADLERLVAAVRGAEPGARVRETVEPSLNRLANLLAGADLLVGNDSGPAHVAAAVGTPTVVVYGPTGTQFMWARVYPRHLGVSLGGACQRLANVPDDADATPCEHACTRRYLGSSGPYPACLEDIPGDLVLAAAKRALDSAASAGHDPRGR